eukprot:jgi/Mesvir1/1634/Mv02872-RA.1
MSSIVSVMPASNTSAVGITPASHFFFTIAPTKYTETSKRLVRESEKAAFPDEEEEVDVDNLPAHAPPKRPLKRLVRLSEKEPETATKPKGGIQSRLRQLVRESEKAAFPDEEEEVDVDNLPAHAPPSAP